MNPSGRGDYHIDAPAEAWALLPQQAFIVNLVDCVASEDGQLKVTLATLGGVEMEFQVAEDSLVGALVQAVKEERQLAANTAVKVVAADGGVLDPDSALQLVIEAAGGR